MAQTPEGAKKAAQTNKERHGEDFYKKIGHLGGKSGDWSKRGFASPEVGDDGLTGRERASKVGQTGGQRSKRRKRYG